MYYIKNIVFPFSCKKKHDSMFFQLILTFRKFYVKCYLNSDWVTGDPGANTYVGEGGEKKFF